jgi:hypothetical protein
MKIIKMFLGRTRKVYLGRPDQDLRDVLELGRGDLQLSFSFLQLGFDSLQLGLRVL